MLSSIFGKTAVTASQPLAVNTRIRIRGGHRIVQALAKKAKESADGMANVNLIINVPGGKQTTMTLTHYDTKHTGPKKQKSSFEIYHCPTEGKKPVHMGSCPASTNVKYLIQSEEQKLSAHNIQPQNLTRKPQTKKSHKRNGRRLPKR